jgi:hypothetical protein
MKLAVVLTDYKMNKNQMEILYFHNTKHIISLSKFKDTTSL